MRVPIIPYRSADNSDIRLGLRVVAHCQRQLHTYEHVRAEDASQRLVGERHSSGVWALLRRHGQDLPTNELDPVVLRQNACLGHPLIFRPCPAPRLHCTHVTVPAHRTALNRREASSPMRSTHGMCRSILRGIEGRQCRYAVHAYMGVRDIRISAPLNR